MCTHGERMTPNKIPIKSPYTPRKWQKQVHKASESHRFVVCVAHRRFGKTVSAINDLIKTALTCKLNNPRTAYIAPTFRQGKAIAWDYLKFYTRVIPDVKINESELRVDFPNGGQVRIYGADNPDSLRGIYLDHCVLDEMGLMHSDTFSQVIRPALSDRTGKALFIGTPNGKNAFWELARHSQSGEQDWAFLEFRASVTGLMPPDELASAKSVMTREEFDQEYECSFEASVRGSIFGEEIAAIREAGQIMSVPYDPIIPVHTAWDLGIGDSTAIWFYQTVRNGEVRLIDYYEASGEGFGHYAQILQQRGYTYGNHFAPHDIQVRELGSGKSRLEIARSLGIGFRVAPALGLEDGINAARMLLPRCWFDAKKTAVGLDMLINYRRDYNSRMGEFKATPVHDYSSHCADSFRYLAISIAEPKAERVLRKASFDQSSLGWMT